MPAQESAHEAHIIERASFNPLIRPYLVLNIAFLLTVSIVGIVALPFWLLGLGQWWARHYFKRLLCELSDRNLRYRKGILVTVEKTIPLENIQDVTFIEGPLLRYFHLAILKFETAGNAAGQANEMKLVGIIDAQEFRNRILEARDRLKAKERTAAKSSEAELLAAIQRDVREMLELMRGRQPRS
ncbi:MAG: PH domain-containing protein [Bryobacterales bacterium]|nr:PH domain-containing protein [Bryobacterales bacterium]